MKSTKLGQSPAFSCGTDNYTQKGISIRLYLAGMAMQGLLSAPHTTKEKSIELIISESYQCADELLKQEAEDGKV